MLLQHYVKNMLILGSRLKTSLDFGHVVLEINGARASDSGLYTCKAINALGEAVSTTSIKVEGKQETNFVEFSTSIVKDHSCIKPVKINLNIHNCITFKNCSEFLQYIKKNK